MRPVAIKLVSPTRLVIQWDDGHGSTYLVKHIREACPCASCNAEREEQGQQALLPIVVAGKCEIKTIEPVGQYAININWGDGHRTGIYTFDHLRSLCECEICSSSFGK